jgi:hypothetical protein
MAWRLDGKPRTARRFTVYNNCPLPTPDRLLFILAYVKMYSPGGKGACCEQANQWIHVLLLLLAACAPRRCPCRSLTALAQRLGVSEADAAVVVLLEEESPSSPRQTPLVPMTARNVSSAPKTLLNRKSVRAGRKRTIRSKTSCWSMRCSSSSSSARRLEAAP